MPNLKGKSIEAAINILEGNDISYNIIYKTSNDVSENTVIEQSIKEGSKTNKKQIIVLTVSKKAEAIEDDEASDNQDIEE